MDPSNSAFDPPQTTGKTATPAWAIAGLVLLTLAVGVAALTGVLVIVALTLLGAQLDAKFKAVEEAARQGAEEGR